MKTTTIVAIILGILLLVSLVQAVQLNNLKDKMEEGELSIGSKSASSSSSGSSTRKAASPPPSIQNLPQMVGGC